MHIQILVSQLLEVLKSMSPPIPKIGGGGLQLINALPAWVIIYRNAPTPNIFKCLI